MSEGPQHLFDLTGQVAIVTGSASGLGVGIARILAEAGAFVVAADIADAEAAAQVDLLLADGLPAAAMGLDIGDEASIVAFCEAVVARHGAPAILVNNAGLQDRQLLVEATAEEWDRINRVNARGPFLLTREVARRMIDAGNGGRIINVASASLTGQIVTGLASYTASKGAVLGLSRASALELAPHGITVNVVHPGGVITPGSMQAKGPPTEGPARRPPPLGRCEPQDIGAAVLFFASSAGRFVTNQVLNVDGGFSVT